MKLLVIRIQAAALLRFFQFLFWFLPPAYLTRTPRLPVRKTGRALEAAVIAHAISKVPLGSCLPRAFACQWLLAWYGHSSAIRIGVRNADTFAAHAWVECGGEVVLGASLDRFEPLLVLAAKA